MSHEALLRDGRRNRAFWAALSRTVRPESYVLDIGAGTGVWSIAAARLGARRVVAVEADPILAGLIRRLADRNGAGRCLEVVVGDSRALALEREFDLIVSETIGNAGFEEDLVEILTDARDRFGRPGVRLVPSELETLAAPVETDPPKRLPESLPLDFQELADLLPHSVREAPRPLRLLAPPERLCHVDLTGASENPARGTLGARWRVTDARAAAGFALWARALLAPGVRLDTRRTSSWRPVLLPIAPFSEGEGELELEVALAGDAARWSVTFASAAGRRSQTLSPAVATTTLALWASGRRLDARHAGILPSVEG